MKVLVATNNQAKVERFKNLLSHTDLDIELVTPKELGIKTANVKEDGDTLAENAQIKARAYFGKADIPILSNDTGFYVEGEGLVEAPKRVALGAAREHELTQEEITHKLLDFWKKIATKYGGKVDAAWVEEFVVLYPDGEIKKAPSRREVILTNREFGKAHPQFPVRALYISKATNKPSVTHTVKEEILELQPITNALISVLSK